MLNISNGRWINLDWSNVQNKPNSITKINQKYLTDKKIEGQGEKPATSLKQKTLHIIKWLKGKLLVSSHSEWSWSWHLKA